MNSESIEKNEELNVWEASLENPQEIPPELVGEYAVTYSRWEMILQNPSIRDGVKALLRTIANTGISAVDVIPVAGEGASWGADSLKMLSKLRWLGKLNFLTPDVPLKGALASEAGEVFGGAMPTHIYETLHQFFKGDLKTIQNAIVALRETLKFDQAQYIDHKKEIDEALATFETVEIGGAIQHE